MSLNFYRRVAFGLSPIEKPDKDLAGFRKDAAEKKTEVAVSTEAKNSVKPTFFVEDINFLSIGQLISPLTFFEDANS